MAYHYGNPHLTEEEERERQRQRQMQAQQSRYSRPNTLPNPGIFARYLPLSTGLLGGAGLMMYPSELGHGMIRPGHIGPLVDGPDWPGLTPEQWDAETKRRYDEAIRDFEAESRRSYPVGGYTDNTGLLLALKKGLNAYRDLFGPTYNLNQQTPGGGGGGGGYSGYETPGLSDWLNENVPPLKPAPEVPEYTLLDYEPTPYETEPWVSYWKTIPGEWDLATISKYNMDYNDSQEGPAPYAPPGKIPDYMYANPHLNLPANPWPEYADAEGYAEEAMQPFSRGPDGITPVWSWEIKNEEFRKQQEFAERKHREEYNSMVAEMVEKERLRQEEYAAERQRYTDMYNADSFFDNLDKNAPPSTSGGFNVFDMIPGTFESVIDMIDPVNTTPTVNPAVSALLDHFGIDQKYETPQEDIDALMGDILAE